MGIEKDTENDFNINSPGARNKHLWWMGLGIRSAGAKPGKNNTHGGRKIEINRKGWSVSIPEIVLPHIESTSIEPGYRTNHSKMTRGIKST